MFSTFFDLSCVSLGAGLRAESRYAPAAFCKPLNSCTRRDFF